MESGIALRVPQLQLVPSTITSETELFADTGTTTGCEVTAGESDEISFMEETRQVVVSDGITFDDAHIADDTTNPSVSKSNQAPSCNKTKITCCNCNSEEAVTSLHEFVKCSIFNAMTERFEHRSVRIMDVLESFVMFDFVNKTKENDLCMCANCVKKLMQLYQLYNEFIALSIQSDSALAEYTRVSVLLKQNDILKAHELPKEGFAEIQKNEQGQTLIRRVLPTKNQQTAQSKIKQASFRKCSNRKKRTKVSFSPVPANSQVLISSAQRSHCEIELDESRGTLDNGTAATAAFIKSRETGTKKKGVDCDRCGKYFQTIAGLKIHYASHVRDDNKFICNECGKKFHKLEALQLHEKIEHMVFKPHKCPHEECNRSFRLKDKLRLHIKVVHEKRKPFPCPKCDKSFRTKYHLKVHDVGQHVNGDNSTGCNQCKRKFGSPEALEEHIKVHETENDKPFVCNKCQKGFQTSTRLKLHSKSHEAPSCICPICGKSYKHIRDLRLHEVVHQDESTFRFGCGDCPKRFYRLDLLRVHQSNEKHFTPEIVGPTVSPTKVKEDTSEKIDKRQRRGKHAISKSRKPANGNDESQKAKSPSKHRRKQGANRKTEDKVTCKIRKDSIGLALEFLPTMVPVNLGEVVTSGLERVENSAISDSNRNTDQESNADIESPLPFMNTSVDSGIYNLQRQGPATSSGLSLNLLPASEGEGSLLRDSTDRQFCTFSIAAGAEQIGFDVISAFINNLN